MTETTELEKLVAFLATELPETQISFCEESDPDIRYALVVGTEENQLLHKLARLFGCFDEKPHWADHTHFEADDDWHGRGKVNLRDLADEFIAIKGEFFDFSITIAELRMLAGRQCERL